MATRRLAQQFQFLDLNQDCQIQNLEGCHYPKLENMDRRGIEPRISQCHRDVFPLALSAQRGVLYPIKLSIGASAARRDSNPNLSPLYCPRAKCRNSVGIISYSSSSASSGVSPCVIHPDSGAYHATYTGSPLAK